MGIKSILKTSRRVVWRITIWTFLLSLPITIFPLIAGIEGAITFHIWNRRQVKRNVNLLLAEADRWNFMNYFDVPNGDFSIHDFFDEQPPFHIPKLATVDWLEKLGLERPLEFDGMRDGDVGIDKMAALEGLVRDVNSPRCQASTKGKEANTNYWVYVTSMPEYSTNPWDQAFDELLREVYISSLPGGPGLYYLDCSLSGFLCGVWDIKPPSLMHFQIADKSLAELEAELAVRQEHDEDISDSDWLLDLIATNYTYQSPSDALYPATVRVVELPLEDNIAASLLPRSALPTPRLQLQTVLYELDQTALLSRFDRFDQAVQTLRRFNDYHNFVSEKRGTVRFYFTELDTWWSDTIIAPVFGTAFTGNDGFMSLVQGITFTTSVLLVKPVVALINLIWNIYAWYMGLGWDGTPENQAVVADIYPDDRDGSSGWGLLLGNNFMSDMFAGFMEFLRQNVSAERSEQAAQAAITESSI